MDHTRKIIWKKGVNAKSVRLYPLSVAQSVSKWTTQAERKIISVKKNKSHKWNITFRVWKMCETRAYTIATTLDVFLRKYIIIIFVIKTDQILNLSFYSSTSLSIEHSEAEYACTYKEQSIMYACAIYEHSNYVRCNVWKEQFITDKISPAKVLRVSR